jgi:cell pole-organizing protein PopZ
MSESDRAKAGTEPDKPAGDPSMEDILASIRRILAEEEAVPTPAALTPPPVDPVLQLDASMLVQEPAVPTPASASEPATALPEPPPHVPAHAAPLPDGPRLVAPEAAAAAARSVGSLVRTLVAERSTQVYSGGPTIEDVVRSELRPLLKQWLDANLPPLVERLVRAELERVVGRAVP